MDDGRGLGDVGERLVRRDPRPCFIPLPLRWRPGRRRRGCRQTPWRRCRRRRRDDRGRRRGREGRRGVAVLPQHVALEEGGVVPQHRPLDAGPQIRLLPRHQVHDVICAGARGMPRLKGRLQHGLDVVGIRDPVRRLHEGGVVRRQSMWVFLPIPRHGGPRRRRGHGQRGRRRRSRRQWRRRGRVGGARPPRHLSVARQLARQGRVRLELAGVGRFARRRRERPCEVCVDAPDLENMLLPLRRRQIHTGALRRQGPARRVRVHNSRFGARERANRVRRNWLRVRRGARARQRDVDERALSPGRRERACAVDDEAEARDVARAVRQLLDREVVAVTAPGIAARAILADAVFHADAVVNDDAPTRPERDRQGDRVAVPQVHPRFQLELPD